MQKLTTKLIIFAVCCIFIIPFLVTCNTGTMPASYNTFAEYLCAIFIFLLLFILYFSHNKLPQLKLSFTTILILFFVAFLASQYSILQPNYVAPYINTISALLISVMLIILIDNSSINQKTLYKTIAVALIINSYIQIIESSLQLRRFDFQIYNIPFYGFEAPYKLMWSFFAMPDYNRITGGIGQPNNLADMLGWGIIANIYLLFNTKNLYHKIFYYFTSIIISIFIGFTQSRTALLYPVALFLYSLLLLRNPASRKLSYHIIINCAIMVICFFLAQHILSWINTVGPVHLSNTKISQLDQNKVESINQRYYIWLKGALMFISHPILGVGWNNYYGHFISTVLPISVSWQMVQIGMVPNSHNIIVQFIATTGIIGTAIFIAFMLYKLWQLSKLTTDQQIFPIGIALIALTHSMFEYPLFVGEIFFPFVLVFCTYDHKTITINRYKLFRRTILALIIAGTAILINNINTMLMISQMKKPPHYVLNNFNYNLMNAYTRTSSNVYFDNVADYMLLNNIVMTERNQKNTKMFDTYYVVLTRALSANPNPIYVMNHIIMDVIYGKTDQAKASIHSFLVAYPVYKVDFKNLAKLHTGENKTVYNQIVTMIDNDK